MMRSIFFCVLIGSLVWTELAAQSAQQRLSRSAQIADAIDRLGSADFFEREAAQRELRGYGFDAVDALVFARNHPEDLEIRARASYLLRTLQVEWVREDDSPVIQQHLKTYAGESIFQRQMRIENLANLANGQGLPALCRIVRFERSLVLSKEAAVAILSSPEADTEALALRKAQMQQTLGQSFRPGANWVRCYLRTLEDLPGAIQETQRYIEQEKVVLQQAPQYSSREIVLDLLQFLVKLHQQNQQPKQAWLAMMEMVDLQGPDAEILEQLLGDVIAEADWKFLDRVWQRFPQQIEQQPRLLYLLALAHHRMNKPERADKLVAQARGLAPGDPNAHFLQAHWLAEQGFMDWSEQEADLVRKIGVERLQLDLPGDTRPVSDLVRDYCAQTEHVRMQRIRFLANEQPETRLSALCRIVRFEPSERLAKHAAAVVLSVPYVDGLQWPERAQTIDRSVGLTEREAIRWLRAYLLNKSDPEEAIHEFHTFALLEQDLLEREPEQTDPQLVQTLWKRHIWLLWQQGEYEKARPRLKEVVKLQDDDHSALEKLVALLLRGQAWDLIVDLNAPERNMEIAFRQRPFLAYALAKAYQERGQTKEAQRLQMLALSLNPHRNHDHWELAMKLADHGLYQAAMKEYQYLIDLSDSRNIYALPSMARLAAIQHDLGDDQAAAQTRMRAYELVKSDPARFEAQLGDSTAESLLPIVYFYRAAHHKARGAFDQQKQELLKALEIDADDVEVLIELYRLPNKSDELSQRVESLIAKQVQHYRDQVKDQPPEEAHITYNQWAWLVSNTTGDYQEALQCSLKSLDLRPGYAGYLDTLGRCYYALEDYPNAVKHQKMAVQLDPFSIPLQRQLKRFEEALAKSQQPEDG